MLLLFLAGCVPRKRSLGFRSQRGDPAVWAPSPARLIACLTYVLTIFVTTNNVAA